MLSLSPATRIFVALAPMEMRLSFDGLYAHVKTVLSQDPLSGHFFLFTNKPKNRRKTWTPIV
jgi:transposase